MEGREIKITPPDGYEVDKENSTFECIRFKPKVKRWRDKEDCQFGGYYIAENSSIIKTHGGYNYSENYNIFATEKQVKSALAIARISQIMANDERFGGFVSESEWDDVNLFKFVIGRTKNDIKVDICQVTYHFLAFHTRGQRDLFLDENMDLVKDYLML